METNERLEKALMQVAESQIKQFIESLPSLKVGDLKSLEEQVRSTINTMGCLLMETTLSTQSQEQMPASQREGACGQVMRLVGIRGKRLQTLMGPVTLWRPYYHCAGTRAGEEETSSEGEHAAHGEAPADEQWGVQQHRCSVGVQQAISRLCASLTLEEAADTLPSLVSGADVSPTSAQFDPTGRRSLHRARRGAPTATLRAGWASRQSE